MMMIRKMYRVFDELHATEEKALEVLAGWEHKEKINELYAIGDDLNQDFINLDLERGIMLADSLERANEIKEEEEI